MSTAVRGFSIIEVAISLAIVAIMLVAVLGNVGAAAKMGRAGDDQRVAMLLANDLLSEIVGMPYEDPDQTPVAFGREPGEVVATRDDFDDVDDYDEWKGDPPTRRDGSTIDIGAGFERAVEIAWLDPDDLESTVNADRGIKRIRVHVRRAGMPTLTLEALRTSAWAEPRLPPEVD